MTTKIMSVVAMAGMMVLAGCGKDSSSSDSSSASSSSSSSSSQIGMLGFKLGQEVDCADRAAIEALGITSFAKQKDGSIRCEFEAKKPFRKFTTGDIHVDSKTKRVYIISSTIKGSGVTDELEVIGEGETVQRVMMEKLGGEWKNTTSKSGKTIYSDGDLGNGITASVIVSSSYGTLYGFSYGNTTCDVVLRDTKVEDEIKKRKLQKDVDSF